MRRAFVETLCELAEKDPRIILLTGDLGFQMFDEFISRFPGRYLNVGVAEAQLVGMAAGLASEGFRPLTYSIASFMTARPFEHIRVDVAYPGLPVVVVGAGGGFCYSKSGVTHHAPDDIGLMTLLPGMTVVAPGDPNEVRALLPQLLTLVSPSYIRIGKFGEPVFEADSPMVLGKARCLRAGEKLALITTGETAVPALVAADRLRDECGWSPEIVHFHTIKPLDESSLEDLADRFAGFIVVEEIAPHGGLAAAIAGWVVNSSAPVKMRRLGPPDRFAIGNPEIESLRKMFGYDQESIFRTCLAVGADL